MVAGVFILLLWSDIPTQRKRGKLYENLQLTDVVLLHQADVAVQRTVSEQNQHDGALSFLGRGHDVSRVSHHGVLVIGPWTQENPGLVLDVKHPQLAGHVSSGVDFSSIHVDLPLEEKNRDGYH